MRKILFHILGILPCLAVAALLPILPIQRAAVIPHPVYSFTFVSIAGLMNPLRLGIRYQVQWYTVVAFLLLILISGLIGVRIARIFMRGGLNRKE